MVANLSLQVLSVNSVRVSWSRVNDDAVTQYILYYGQLKIDLQEKQVTVPSSADSAVIRDVGEGTYKFEVVTQAQTDSGELWQSGRSHSIVLAIVSSNSSTPSPISNTMGEFMQTCNFMIIYKNVCHIKCVSHCHVTHCILFMV